MAADADKETGGATVRGGFVHALELRRRGSQLMMTDDNRRSVRRQDEPINSLSRRGSAVFSGNRPDSVLSHRDTPHISVSRRGSAQFSGNRRDSAHFSGNGRRDSTMTISGILQRRKTQTQFNQEALMEVEGATSKKVDFQRGMDYGELYTKLCRLLSEGGKSAVKYIFDRFFPPIILKDKLADLNMYKRLEFLANKGLIDDKQWVKLYPKGRQRPSSVNYDLMLLLVMLKHICKLPAPYPNGWYAEPNEDDESVPANLARLGLLRKEVVCRPDMTDDSATHLWTKTLHILTSLAGETVQEMTDKIMADELDDDVRYIFVKRLYAIQDREVDIMDREEQLGKKKNTNDIAMLSLNMSMSPELSLSSSRSSVSRRPSSISTTSQFQRHGSVSATSQMTRRPSVLPMNYVISGQQPGMPKEERHTLLTFYKSLVTHVKAQDIIEQLMKAEIFNQEDVSTVFLSEKNRERMHVLLKILLTKPGPAYSEFCKPIKFKHAHLFELMNRTYHTLKRQAATRKPEGLPHTMEHIQAYCNQLLTRWRPVTWSGAQLTTVREHYIPLQLVAQDGSLVDIQDLVVPRDASHRGLVIHGASGSGKSSLCRFIVFSWLSGTISSLLDYSLLFYIDCRLQKDLQTALYDHMSKDYQFDKDDLWHVLEDNQDRILIILDGLEDDQYIDLVSGNELPECGLLATVSSVEITHRFSKKLELTGLEKYHVGEFIKRYIVLTNQRKEDFNGFYHKLNDCNEDYQAFVLNPFLCSCLCAIRANKLDLNANTETELLDQFLRALIKSQSGKRMELHNKIAASVAELQYVAFHAKQTEKSLISVHSVEGKCGNLIWDLGLILKYDRKCGFLNKTVQDFLAAKFIQSYKSNDYTHITDMLSDNSCEDIRKYLCGMQSRMSNENLLRDVMANVCERNLSAHKNVRFQEENQRYSRGLSTARITELSQSLQCVHESQGCHWIAEMVVRSLPERLVLKSGSVAQNALLGLADILKLNIEGVQEMDVYITEELNIRRYGVLKIAQAIQHNEHLRYLRIEWSSNELFTKFLCDSFSEDTNIHTVKMIHKPTRLHRRDNNALVQAHLLHACEKMVNVSSIIFQDCRDTCITTCFIRNCSRSLTTLDLSGCHLNTICTKELAQFLEYSTKLVSLNLTDVRLSGLLIFHFTEGIKANKTLEELVLCNCKLDEMGQYLLADALSFCQRLVSLDISKNSLTLNGCQKLAKSLELSASIQELIILGDHLEPNCFKALKNIQRPGFRIIEDCTRPSTAAIHAD